MCTYCRIKQVLETWEMVEPMLDQLDLEPRNHEQLRIAVELLSAVWPEGVDFVVSISPSKGTKSHPVEGREKRYPVNVGSNAPSHQRAATIMVGGAMNLVKEYGL